MPRKRETLTSRVVRLRELGLSWYEIGKIVFPDLFAKDPDRARWRVYGLYWNYVCRTGKKRSVVRDGDSVPVAAEVDAFKRVHVSFSYGTLSRKEKRMVLSKEERHKEELLRLCEVIYDQLFSAVDKDKLILAGIHFFGRRLLKYVDVSKASADVKGSKVGSVSPEALAFVYVTFYLATYGTVHHLKMSDVVKLIFSLLPKRRKQREEKKKMFLLELKKLMYHAAELQVPVFELMK